MNLESLRTKIRECCKEFESVLAAYLFGSSARETTGPKSDLDLALLVEPEAAAEFPVLEFIASLERTCKRRVDLVLLNRAGEVLKFQIRRQGKLIFERDPGKRKCFEIRSRRSYEDFLHMHKRYVRAVLYGG